MKLLKIRQLGCLILSLAAYQLAAIGNVILAVDPALKFVPTIQISDDEYRSLNARPANTVTSVQSNQVERNSAGCLTPSQFSDVVPSIYDVKLDVLKGPGQAPKSCFAERHLDGEIRTGNVPRGTVYNDYHWKASGLFSNPLYFEDVSLERYGRVSCVQNALSGAKFFGTVAILPYKMGVDCPRECVYALGPTRPGNCAPAVCEKLPCSARGMALQAAAVTGIGFLFP
jgi:hypothetical protein